MFRRAVLILTLWYLAVIMVLSALFSVFLYKASTRELDALQHDQEQMLQKRFPLAVPSTFSEIYDARTAKILEAKDNIAAALAYFNLIILLGAGALSYVLAYRTLRPLEEAHESQNRFTADASHELRTPLTAMRTEIEVALRGKLTVQEARELLRSNLEEIQRLEALSSGLLRLAGGEKPDVSHDVRLRDILQQAVSNTRTLAAHAEMELTVPDVDMTVKGELWSLAELFSILLENAIKYSPPKSAVRVEVARSGTYVRVSVIDKGIGMKLSDLPHIFERFYRADTSRSKHQVEGYGLGLSIAKKIVDAHNGSIEVRSTPGKGSTFTVILPT